MKSFWWFVKELQFRLPFRHYFFPRYQFMMSPPQLGHLCGCLDATRSVPGAILEVGCAAGATTLFLNRHMDAQGIDKPYLCVDTFAGFPEQDLSAEAERRAQYAAVHREAFTSNSRRWFEGTMARHRITRVRAFEADANEFPFEDHGPYAFILLDVDLYRPISRCLPVLYDLLSPGGILVVDDCDPAEELWLGAFEAWEEFVADGAYDAEIVFDKLGTIRKPLEPDRV